MKTFRALPVSTLALAYRNGSNYMLNNELHADVPKGEGQLWRISEGGQLSSVSAAEWDELAHLSYLESVTAPQGAREIPTE